MQRKNIEALQFTVPEQELVDSLLSELSYVFDNPKLRETNLFIEGGVGRGVLPLLLLKNLAQLKLDPTRYVGLDVIRAVSGRKKSALAMSPTEIAQSLTQPPFSAHGELEYSQRNQSHHIEDDSFYSDNNVLEGDCFDPKTVQNIAASFPDSNPVFVSYNAIGAFLNSDNDYRPDTWFNQQLPYIGWLFLTHHATPWEVENATTDNFSFYRDWNAIKETCIRLNLSVYLLRNGLAAVR